MIIAEDIPSLRQARAAMAGKVGFVPTMGALHDGHLALVARARQEADHVIASIFVNPTQFGEAADLAAYPRTLAADVAKLREAGVSAVFTPEVAALYPPGAETIVETTDLAQRLHGAVRPGHFRGVTTVVAKLFNLVQPDVACFGEKDYQQLIIIRKMVRDLCFPIQIIAVPTCRAPDGLALSSRNARLTAADRAAAVVLHQALEAASHADSLAEMDRIIRAVVDAEPRATLKGLDIAEADSLAPPQDRPGARVAVMLSAAFGDVLLIDQKVIQL